MRGLAGASHGEVADADHRNIERLLSEDIPIEQQIPNIHAIYVERDTPIPFAYGAKGIGEFASIPIAPAIANAYYAFDHEFRTKLPMDNTFYRKKKA